ncbi:hypothetical protein PV328_008392 [Microctonus aethiopoides]|uniref:Uncharacterized protein n=1 Tax=Microctonus aethiopoides TaxID=144406 RepID=A0AA39FJF1_9HYME|nr:hypothetical protein PV328_008392 [Microctonus aethiopoides]
MEWMNNNNNIPYGDIITNILKITAEYADCYGTYTGCVINFNDIEAALIIDHTAKMWWYRRIRIENDPRPPTIHYYPRLAPPELEEEWCWWSWVGNNNNYDGNENNNDDNENNNVDEININNENNDNNEMMTFLQNWIIATSEVNDNENNVNEDNENQNNNDDDDDEMIITFLQHWLSEMSEDE